MKKVLLVILSCVFSFKSFAFNLVCSCPEDNCKDLRIESTSSTPGTYLKVFFEEGSRTLEGFAKIYKNNRFNKTVYSVGSFTLVKQGDVFTVSDSRRQCLEN